MFETLEPRLLLAATLSNGLPLGNPLHFSIDLGYGCTSRNGSFAGVGDPIYDYMAYLDVNGEVFDFSWLGTDAVGGGSSATSTATFSPFSGGTIDVQITSTLAPGAGHLFTSYVFTASGGADLRQARFFQYLDSDLGTGPMAIWDDVLTVTGSVAGGDLVLATVDPPTSVKLAQSLGGTMVNAAASGFAADVYDDLQLAILLGGFDAAPGGTIDTNDLPPGFQPGIGNAYGPDDVTTAVEYSFSGANAATLTTVLGLAHVPITVPDLTVPSVSAPAVAVSGQPITVDWRVVNDSLIPAPSQPWRDRVYLSTDDVLSGDDMALNDYDHTTGLAGQAGYNMSETMPTLHVPPGLYYVIVETDQTNAIDETPMEFNNIGVSANQVLFVEPLTLDAPAAGTLSGDGDTLYFGVVVPAGEYLQVTLDDANDQGTNELLLGYGLPPTQYIYDARVAGTGDQTIVFGETQAGSYIIVVNGLDVPDAPAGFTLTASLKDFGVTDISPDAGGNAGSVTATIRGTRLTNQTTVVLDDGAGNVIPGAAIRVDGMTLLATFDLIGAPIGLYDVVLSDPAAAADVMLVDAFTVFEGGAADVQVDVSGASYLRNGRPATFLVNVVNAGNLDAPLPWLGISVGGVHDEWQLGAWAGETDFEILALPDGHLLDVLAPGQGVTFPLIIDNVDPTGGLSVAVLDESSGAAAAPVDWAAVRAAMPAMQVDQAAADAAWADLVAALGPTWGDALGVLRDRAVAAGDALAPIDVLLTDAFDEFLAAYIPNPPVHSGSWQWHDLTGFLSPMEGTADAAAWNVVTVGGGTVIGAPTGVNGYLLPTDVMDYEVFFEYDPPVRPAPPARVVTISTVLDGDLDLSTFELTEISFGHHMIVVPPGLTSYTTTVDLRAEYTNLLVEIVADLDVASSTVTWTFTTLDPATNQLPVKWWLGFLPPNDASHAGEGMVGYRVQAAAGLPAGTNITTTATADFDGTAASSAPVVLILDGRAPTSSVKLKSEASLGVNTVMAWSGQDNAGGVGLASYDIYVSDNDGPFTLWLNDTTATSAVFTGERGHTYFFYSVATDKLGNTEKAPFVPDAGVHMRDLFAHTIVGGKQTGTWTFLDGAGNPVEVNLAGSNCTATVYRHVADDQPGDIVTIAVVSEYGASATLSFKTAKGTVTFIEEDILIEGSLKGLLAGGVTLGRHLQATGTMGRIDLGDIDAGHTISIGPRKAGDTKTAVTLNLGRVGDTSVVSETPIKSLTAIEWLDDDGAPDVIEAPWIGKLATKGVKANAKKGIVPVAGDFQAGLTLSGLGAAKATLGSVSIVGDLAEAVWDIVGQVGKLNVRGFARDVTVRATSWMSNVTIGGADGADFLAGVDAAVARRAGAAADFVNPAAGIKSFKVAGIKTGKGVAPPRWFFVDSNISAATIGQVSLLNVDFHNSGTGFGVWAANQGTGKEIKSVKWSDKVDKDVKGQWPPKPGEVFDVPNLDVQLL
ncbi:MAG TPA: LEPR-XLL domain-containing protein [Phycisphaerae bacterium]|nr:LEPR-XLL domain-containing protein [Phycisphaerae bacterium]